MKPKSAKSRSDLILATYKFCKKEYPAILPPSNRTVLEHMLYACCLENSTEEAADEAFAKLMENFFDWNEVRVTTVAELAEIMKRLSFPRQSASGLKKTLHGVFEGFYQFDLDFLRKENLSKAVAHFQKFKGVSPYIISYAAQHGLGGHSIPLDRAMMFLFYTLGIVDEEEALSGHVTGLERTISKSQGIEFSSSVHQLAVAFLKTPFNPRLRDQLVKINPDAKNRFPKRASKKKIEEEIEVPPAEPDPLPETLDETPKKRGRKKKVVPASEKPASSGEMPIKRKVGRPRKHPLPAEPAASERPRKRGRKKMPMVEAKKKTTKRPKPR